MSEATLMVPTAFSDISQLAEGLTGRVESDRLMLYGPEPYEPGTTVHFSLTLHDGGVAFEGTGRAIHSVDGGGERPEVARFDIILDSLEFAGSGQVVYDRILLELQGEVGYSDADAHEVVAASDYTVDDSEFEDAAGSAAVEDVGLGVDAYAEAGDVGEAADVALAAVDQGTEAVDYGDADLGIDVVAAADEASPVEVATAHGEEWPAAPPDETYGGGDSGPATPDEGYAASDWDATGDAGAASVEVSLPDEAELAGFEDVRYGDSDLVDTTHEIDVSDAVAPDSSLYSDGTGSASAIDEAPPMPPAPKGFDVELRVSARQVLSRPGLEPTWQPVLDEVEPPRPASGYFEFSGGLPAPAVPPRPDLDPSYRVDPAPRPGQPGTRVAGPEPAPVPVSADVESVAPPNGSSDASPVYYEADEEADEDVVDDHEAARDTDAPNPYAPGEVDVDIGSFPPAPDSDVEASFDDVARDVDDPAWLDPDLPEADHRER